jgi:crotonobetainyl-CoA:carnitine CoA-transferase CaiB-like acyl-CoA transferase
MPGPLSDLRVIDFSQYLAGPLVAMQLADLGADVVRVDPPGGPRWQHPANAVLQRGKRSIVLDLTDPADRATAQRLVDAADVVVESWRPGVADRLGVGPEKSLARNPRLVSPRSAQS